MILSKAERLSDDMIVSGGASPPPPCSLLPPLIFPPSPSFPLLSFALLSHPVQALADLSPALQDPDNSLLPDLHDVRAISGKVAVAVIKAAQKEGSARAELP